MPSDNDTFLFRNGIRRRNKSHPFPFPTKRPDCLLCKAEKLIASVSIPIIEKLLCHVFATQVICLSSRHRNILPELYLFLVISKAVSCSTMMSDYARKASSIVIG